MLGVTEVPVAVAQVPSPRKNVVEFAVPLASQAVFAFVEVFGFYYAVKTGVDFSIALDMLWDNETQIVWASVVSFWFGSQAFKSK